MLSSNDSQRALHSSSSTSLLLRWTSVNRQDRCASSCCKALAPFASRSFSERSMRRRRARRRQRRRRRAAHGAQQRQGVLGGGAEVDVRHAFFRHPCGVRVARAARSGPRRYRRKKRRAGSAAGTRRSAAILRRRRSGCGAAPRCLALQWCRVGCPGGRGGHLALAGLQQALAGNAFAALRPWKFACRSVLLRAQAVKPGRKS